MFHESESVANTFFTELAAVRGSVALCGRCGKRLSKNLAVEHLHSPGIVSFWFIRCPGCRAGHVVFNDTSVLPPPREPEPATLPLTPGTGAATG